MVVFPVQKRPLASLSFCPLLPLCQHRFVKHPLSSYDVSTPNYKLHQLCFSPLSFCPLLPIPPLCQQEYVSTHYHPMLFQLQTTSCINEMQWCSSPVIILSTAPYSSSMPASVCKAPIRSYVVSTPNYKLHQWCFSPLSFCPLLPIPPLCQHGFVKHPL